MEYLPELKGVENPSIRAPDTICAPEGGLLSIDLSSLIISNHAKPAYGAGHFFLFFKLKCNTMFNLKSVLWRQTKKDPNNGYCTVQDGGCLKTVEIDVQKYSNFKAAVASSTVAVYFSGTEWQTSGLFDILSTYATDNLASGALNIVKLPETNEAVSGSDFFFLVDGTVTAWSPSVSTGTHHLVLEYDE